MVLLDVCVRVDRSYRTVYCTLQITLPTAVRCCCYDVSNVNTVSQLKGGRHNLGSVEVGEWGSSEWECRICKALIRR